MLALGAAVLWAPGAFAATVINSNTTYSLNTSWTAAGSPYILNANVTVASSATLTVDPGVVVKFNGTFREMVVNGVLSAVGSEANKIVFTSIKDDSVGGDSGGDGPTSGAPGEWLNVRFGTGSVASVLRWVEMRYGGYGSGYTAAPLKLGSSSAVLVEDSSITDSGNSSCIAGGTGSTVTVSRSVLSRCGGNGLTTQEGALTADQNTITDNGRNGVYVQLGSSYAGAPSVFTRNTVTDNERAGLDIYAQVGVPVSSYPAGLGNNIHSNTSAITNDQLHFSFSPPAGAGWKGNYFGPTASWWANPAACAGTSPKASGFLVDTSRPSGLGSGFPPYKGVTSYKLYTASGSSCGVNDLPVAPWDFFLQPVDTDLPVGAIGGMLFKQALGGAGDTPDARNPTHAEAEPVNTATGNYFRSETDVRLYGELGVQFALTRTYNSADPTVGTLGPGWTHNLNLSLLIAANGDVSFRDGGGAQLDYVKQPNGSFVGAPGVLSQLVSVTGGYELTRKDQVVYAFNTSGRLSSIKDRNGKGLTFAYDGSSRLSAVTDAASRQVAFAYNGGGQLSSVTLPDSRHVDYGYTTTTGVTRLTSVTDARGKVWSYVYESHGLLEKVIDPNTHTLVRNVYGSDGRVTDQYDALNHHGVFAWDPATQTSTFTDARGKQWRDVYDRNVLQKTIDPLGNETRFEYDAALNTTEVTDPRGYAITMGYDASGNLTSRTAPSPLSYTESWTYTARNDVASYTNRRGFTTSYGYDTAGNLTSIGFPDPDGGGPLSAPTVGFTRDGAGSGLLTAFTDQRSKTTSFAYTSGNLTLVSSPLGNKTSYGYDSSGRRTSMVEPRGNASGATPSQYTTSYAYNNNDQLTTLTTPLGHVTSWAFDDAGLLGSTTDANSHITSYTYDAANHLTQVTAPDPDGTGPLAAPTTGYGYDAAYNLTTRTDANSHQTGYGYDDAGRLTAMSTPLGNQWSYSYDASGNLTTLVDANGNASGTPGDGTTSLAYDQVDRLTAIDYSDSTPDVGFAYDANSNRSSMSDGLTGSETRSYDRLDRLTTVTRGSDTFAYEYDPANNLTRRTYPGSIDTDYGYDNDERLSSVTANGATTGYSYDEAGNVITITLPSANGHVEARVFDRSGRLTDVWNKSGSSTLSRFQLTLDPVGNPTQIVRSGTPAETRKYQYDNIDRLTEVCFQVSACSGGSDPFIRWAYDGVGNRLTESRPTGTTSYSYDNDDRLLTAGSTSYAFDHNGNQTQAGARTFAWDLANRLASTTLSGTTTSYTYTGDGRRASSTTGATVINALWDVNQPLPQLAIEREGSGALLRRYTYGHDRLALTTPAGSFYYHYDDLRTATNLTNASGAKQWTYSYEPYGALKSETQDSGSAPSNVFKFTGEQHDPTGLIHLRARQYDPTTGRFTGRDLIDSGGASGYAYALNRPTVYLDPSGLRWCWKACAAVDAAQRYAGEPVVDFARDYYPRNPRELFLIYSIFETGLATAVVAGGTVVTATTVCPAATAAGGPVGAVACGQLIVTGVTLTAAGVAATVKEAQHYAHERQSHAQDHNASRGDSRDGK